MGRMLVHNYGVHADKSPDGRVRGYYASSFNRALGSVRMAPLIKPPEPSEPSEPSGEFTADPSDVDEGAHRGTRGSEPNLVNSANPSPNGRVCRDCHNRPPSAGWPRCEQCHRIHLTVIDGYDR
jgi:hypothetical protein